ncbi:MAG TPA: hypothetical protein VGO56_13115 [Pyrinomonadaceae bacterium]|nr:hypothetical protein [Pyrinomonadaceae bacterium]
MEVEFTNPNAEPKLPIICAALSIFLDQAELSDLWRRTPKVILVVPKPLDWTRVLFDVSAVVVARDPFVSPVGADKSFGSGFGFSTN